MIFSLTRTVILGALLTLLFCGCTQQDMLVEEPVKDIAGAWRITKAVRNGIDITTYTDFSQFRLHFDANKQYTIEHPMPFVVTKNGAYELNDPKYPFHIRFSENGSAQPLRSSFTYPVVNGKRNLVFTFSPGCTANTYVYTLEKVNP
ncbi:DUF5004 domain-containing protein [Chitinophaga sedimenti]|uniref:DUF5004 domain-containing protein n=1 Tax=Chitinophaga sedimenti TaxID=2033606 RepID=UPI002004C7B5|nr:DUF5004 domain-containing protein [Chitinophaga sedimenti]MCK7555956.1 DUF5004 domain-containing protein [Chitinophaga sedimenti]